MASASRRIGRLSLLRRATGLNTMNVLPFLNYVVVVEDPAAEDFAATLQTACENRGGGGFMQASRVSYTCDYSAGGGDGVSVVGADDPAYAEELSDGRITLIDP